MQKQDKSITQSLMIYRAKWLRTRTVDKLESLEVLIEEVSLTLAFLRETVPLALTQKNSPYCTSIDKGVEKKAF